MFLNASKCQIKNGAFSVQCDFSMEIGNHLSLFGPSGSGKSSVLLGLAGFLPIINGDLIYDDKSISKSEPKDRPFDLLFQENNLFPHLTVSRNILLGLGAKAKMDSQNSHIVNEILDLVGLYKEKNRLPENISGGQRSRTAIARSLIRKKPILLLDEPFSALDFELKNEILALLLRVSRKNNLSIILVSHDPRDVQYLGGDVVLFSENGQTEFYKNKSFWSKFSYKLNP
ncbi:MAG: ATP-binding cassette domain-containing protein [Pseudomonadota bacterium]|jgi:thiamine transport system ATP-binding protein|nr:ATP-binding cassette domain-containing protein [Pseudomonadota bacterium]|tara:strand:+ start:1277 stop:1963 length:687 start_codon:yes stop_codon:yes gene_type:complete